MIAILQQLKQVEVISVLDYHFARLINEKQQGYTYPQQVADLAVLLAALSSYHSQNGSSCFDPALNHYDFFDLSLQPELKPFLQAIQQRIQGLPINLWQTVLEQYQHIAFAWHATSAAPLLWENGLVYLRRNWFDEQRVIERLNQRLQQPIDMLDPNKIATMLDQLFPLEVKSEINWQKIAVATALSKNFCLISGGPGTGKTHTVCSLLAALQWQQQQLHLAPLKIALVAPTGKASARLSESLAKSVSRLPNVIDTEVIQHIPRQAQTLHRLLGMSPNKTTGRYNQQQPLAYDLVVLDEASMIDLNLFAQLLDSLTAQTRLVLLGDKDQLASVEAGAVMSELCKFLLEGYSSEHCAYLQYVTRQNLDAKQQGHPLRDTVCFLRKSYRFREDSGIKMLAQAVNEGQANSWHSFGKFDDLALLIYPQVGNDTVIHPLERGHRQDLQALKLILQSALEWYGDYLQKIQTLQEYNVENITAIFAAFNQVRLLAAVRQGWYGVEQLNQTIAEFLRQQGLLRFRFAHEWYHGKAIMVMKNDPTVELYNGDVGLLLTDKQGNSRVWFESSDGQLRDISPSRVPSHEPAFVMTVHKSQGSEFAHTVLVLPSTMNPVLSRELLYTAITRAKSKFTLLGTQRIWQSAVCLPVRRSSGLYKRLNADK